MKRSLLFLFCAGVLTVTMGLILRDADVVQEIPFFYGFVMGCWTVFVAIMYAAVWREEVGYEFQGENEE